MQSADWICDFGPRVVWLTGPSWLWCWKSGMRPGSPGFGGVCGQAFGADGQDDETVRYVKSCKEAWECPDQFQCVRVSGPWGLCVKTR